MTIHAVVQLLVLASETKTTEELSRQFEAVLEAYGFDFYGLVLTSKAGPSSQEHVLASRWPDGWRETYASKKLGLVDPITRMLAIAQRPYRWRDALALLKHDPHRPRMQRVMQEAARHGLHDGYMFPIHGRNGLLGNLAIAGRHVDLSPAELALFDASAQKLFWRMLELKGHAAALEKASTVATPLTRRELEVITHLAEGMTSHEIARSLSISNHTVDWYINGVQDKLKAKNRQHVVAMAFRMGLVT